MLTLEDDRLSRLQADMVSFRAELDHQHRLATIGTLAAGMAHEINNLLTPALAYAQLAQGNPDDRQLAARAIEQCVTAVTAATRVGETLLNFAAPSDQHATAAILQTIEDAITCLGRDLAKEGIQCVIDVPHDLEACISPLALQQVLLNLLINAEQALRQRPAAELRVKAGVSEGRARIVVQDNGPGIPPHIRKHLFQPFAVSRETGRGLGLWVCKRLVENAGGAITVACGEGGTTFTIVLPAA